MDNMRKMKIKKISIMDKWERSRICSILGKFRMYLLVAISRGMGRKTSFIMKQRYPLQWENYQDMMKLWRMLIILLLVQMKVNYN